MQTSRRIQGMLIVLAVCSLAVAAAEMMSVQVQSAPLRQHPSFMGRVLATLVHGERVAVHQKQGAWVQVIPATGSAGWMHSSALTRQRIVMSAGQETVRVDAAADELALAGKGFNSEVEAQFRQSHQQFDFSAVDRMEKIKVSAPEMAAFLKAGGVVPAGGLP